MVYSKAIINSHACQGLVHCFCNIGILEEKPPLQAIKALSHQILFKKTRVKSGYKKTTEKYFPVVPVL
jgi:hypothetical protein